jgi:hypothetical protein
VGDTGRVKALAFLTQNRFRAAESLAMALQDPANVQYLRVPFSVIILQHRVRMETLIEASAVE